MAQNSRYIKCHPDALIEWIQDDQFFYSDNYSIIKDTLNVEQRFHFSKSAQDPNNYNKIPRGLYLIDRIINKYGIADPDNKTFLQESQYTNPAPSEFDRIKIWFPISYTFPNSSGFMIKLSALNFDNTVSIILTDFFLDTTIPANLLLIQNESVPFRYGGRLWGKSITINVPSTYHESRKRVSGQPTLGSINAHLGVGLNGLSQTSPIYIDFRFLTSKQTVLGESTYLSTPSLVVSIPQAPEYNQLAVQVSRATDGDYFLINGLYNGTIAQFSQFMDTLTESGQRSYVLYKITVFEDALPQPSQDIYKYEDYLTPYSFCPILKTTNTSATIQVELQLISAIDGSVISRFADLAIVGSEVAKYGRYRQAINVSSAIKPKLYNSKPDNIILPSLDILKAGIIKKNRSLGPENIRYVPYPVLTDTYNIAAQDVTLSAGDGTRYFGKGGLLIALTPFDNVLKFKISQLNGSENVKPFQFPASGSIIQLVFKSSTAELRVPLWNESGEVQLDNGVLVFKQVASEYTILKKVFETVQSFYITMTTNGVETSIYDGRFQLLEEQARTVPDVVIIGQRRRFSIIESGGTTALTIQNAENVLQQVQLSPITPETTTRAGNEQKALDAGLTRRQLRNIS